MKGRLVRTNEQAPQRDYNKIYKYTNEGISSGNRQLGYGREEYTIHTVSVQLITTVFFHAYTHSFKMKEEEEED